MGAAAGRYSRLKEVGLPSKWLMQAVSTGNEDSLSRGGNEVSVVIKREVSMAMQRAVCIENLLGVEGATRE